MHGQGAYSFASGNEYVGEWNDDERNGQGTFTWANGDKHVGEFVNNEFHGIGERIYINGDKYVGNFEQGKRHGQGTFTWSDGEKYVGEWFANEKHGQGAYSFANGNEYVGEWNDGKRSGEGTFTWANGDKNVGRIGVLPFRRISEFVNPANREFAKTLDELIALMELDGDTTNWYRWMVDARRDMNARRVLDAYGGMGSFNDHYPLKLELNDEFERLRSETYRLAKEIIIGDRSGGSNVGHNESLGLEHGSEKVLKRDDISEAVLKCTKFVFSNGNGSEAFVPDTNIRIRLLDHEDLMDEGHGERSTGELRLYEGEDCIAWITNENNGRGIEKLINLAKLL